MMTIHLLTVYPKCVIDKPAERNMGKGAAGSDM
jgi:hypothetical protein